MKDILCHTESSGSGLTHLSNCCLVPVTAAREVSLAAAEGHEGAQLLLCLTEHRSSRWKPRLTYGMCLPARSCVSFQPHSQPSRRPVQNLGAKAHCLLLFPRQAKEGMILPQVIRELWIKMEMPSSSTLSSASLCVSAVLALPLRGRSVGYVLSVT